MHRFFRAHRSDSRAYFAGFNALMLAFLLEELGISETEMGFGHPPYSAPDHRDHLRAVVRYTATCEHQQALEDGDYVKQFWCTTTLAGLHLIEGEDDAALVRDPRSLRHACCHVISTANTSRSVAARPRPLYSHEVPRRRCQDRRKDLGRQARSLQLHPCGALARVTASTRLKGRRHGFRPIVSKTCLTQIRRALDQWAMKPGDLAICGATTESDIIFAEACLERKLRVRILIREPLQAELDGASRWPALASPSWHERFHALRQRHETEVWIDTEHLGPTPSGQQSQAQISLCRYKQWLLDTARMEASQTLRPGQALSDVKTISLHGLFLWDGTRMPDDPNDPAEFVHDIERFDRYLGEVRIVEIPSTDAVESLKQVTIGCHDGERQIANSLTRSEQAATV